MKAKELPTLRLKTFRFTYLITILLLQFLFISLETFAQTLGNSTAGTTNYPTTTISDNATETGTVSITSNFVQAANKFTVTGPMTITSFSVYINTSYGTNSMKFAIYPDNGSGTPSGQTLTGQTAGYAFTTGTGWKTITLNSADYIYITTAGTYWLCFLTNASIGQVRRLGSKTDYYFSQTYSSGYPLTFPTNATSETAGTYSFYATGVQIKGYSKATKAVLPTNGTFNSVSFYTHAAGNVRLAIFNDASGTPSAKQWESGDVSTTANALNTVNISSGTPSALNLNAGTYWLTWQWNNTSAGPSYTAGSSGDGNYMIQSTYGSFPSNWSGGTTSAEKWSISASYSTCTPPSVYSVTGGGIYCFGDAGKNVGLSNSETGVNYQLLKNGTNTGGTVSGTGAALDFGIQTSGTYTVAATRTIGSCTSTMSGSVTVVANSILSVSVSNQKNVSCYSGNDGEITITASGGAGNYQFSVDNGLNYTTGSNPNPYTANGLSANTQYKIRVKDSNGCESPAIP